MINEENFHFYLRYLVKITDINPIYYNEIPDEFQNFFSVPCLSQSLNIIYKQPQVNYLSVENYLSNRTFDSFESLCEGIGANFSNDFDKLYAAYFYTTHNIEYDYELSQKNFIVFNMSTKSIFENKKGICGDYTKFFIQIAKKSGVDIDQINIDFFFNACKGSVWKPFNPPRDKKSIESNLHWCVYIEFNNQRFLSDPTWGAGRTVDGVFYYDYRKEFFLIPYYTAILQRFPYEYYKYPFTRKSYPFSYQQFASLNRPSIAKEVSLESNPFQVIHTDNGFYEMQFSFIQLVDEISASFQFLFDKDWIDEKPFFLSFTCLDKNIQNHFFSYYPDKKRIRYKMTVILSKKGSWRVVVKNEKKLFEVFFVVNDFNHSFHKIPICRSCFFPIMPICSLTTVNNGYARIRFAFDFKQFPNLKIESYKINSNENESRTDNIEYSFCTELNDIDGDLVENWIFVKFPSKGRWKVCVYSKNESGDFTFFATYLFDVKNTETKYISPVIDLPKNRNFTPFNCDYFSISPSFSSFVVLKNADFRFHVFSKNDIIDGITNIFGNEKSRKEEFLHPKIVSEKKVEKKDVKDREYSIKFTECGNYKLKLNGNEFCYVPQFFVVDYELKDESTDEIELMNNLKKQIETKFDYTEDIPSSIKQQVEIMLSNVPRCREIKECQSACCILI